MKLLLKRVYEPNAKTDGFRVLVDRLWPRGITKAAAKIDLWDKEIAPSSQLRSWFHSDREKRFNEFVKKYDRELETGTAVTNLKQSLKGEKIVTLITAVKDIEHSHIPTILRHLR